MVPSPGTWQVAEEHEEVDLVNDLNGRRQTTVLEGAARRARSVLVKKRARRRNRDEMDLRTPSGRRLPY